MSLKGVAQETIRICDNGYFINSNNEKISISESMKYCIDNTYLYTPEKLTKILEEKNEQEVNSCQIEVTSETTQFAAHRIVVEEGVEDPLLLNFASAKNPGGGFINGAKAQEEDLSRCSGLYPSLMTKEVYYTTNRANSCMLYLDYMIYSPRVPWFRTRSRNMLDYSFEASVLTAPAPNAGVYLQRDGKKRKLEECLRRRCGMVLAAAEEKGHRYLVLGAWGCGVFRNDPDMVADAFGKWLESDRFKGCFDRVIFAIYTGSKNRSTLTSFENRFSI